MLPAAVHAAFWVQDDDCDQSQAQAQAPAASAASSPFGAEYATPGWHVDTSTISLLFERLTATKSRWAGARAGCPPLPRWHARAEGRGE
jgi:hypothetical protein